MKGLSLWQQFWYYLGHNGTYVLQQFNHHFAISVYGVLLAALVGIPLGILISRHHHLNGPIISIANIIQTIPSLAMVSMLMLVLGLGDQTVIVANFLYSLLPIIKKHGSRPGQRQSCFTGCRSWVGHDEVAAFGHG